MLIGVLGINHKLADLQVREMLAIACQKIFHPLSPLREDNPYVLLSTCNRTELYFSSPDLAATQSFFLELLKNEIRIEFEQKLYTFFGKDCFEHLVKVTSGLDSAILAETEIQGQVKSAYEASLLHAKLPPPLDFLFQKSLKIAKDLRSCYFRDHSPHALEQAVYLTGKRHFESATPSILFIGASEINQKVLEYLQLKGHSGITLCNRTASHGARLSEKFQVPLLDWNDIHGWHAFDWIILGTKAQDFLIHEKCLQNPFAEKKLLIDLGLPRNADPKINKDPRIKLLNIDQMNAMVQSGQKQLKKKQQLARHTISQEVSKQISLYQIKMSRHPLFAA